jgi:hypothetical protein
MLSSFLSRFDELQFEEFGWLTLLGAERAGDGAALSLHLRTDEFHPDRIAETWQVRCARWFDWSLTSRGTTGTAGVELHMEHPLLWDYVEPTTSVSFRGRPASAMEVALNLRDLHARVFAPFTVPSHLNGALDLVSLLSGGSGLLASGPVSLMRRYAEICEAHGLEHTLLPEHPPVHREYGDTPGSASDVRALTFGHSYVIGAGFTAERLEDG